jgi:hypothetical protein
MKKFSEVQMYMCNFTEEYNVRYVYKTYIFPNTGQIFLQLCNSYQKKIEKKLQKNFELIF